MGESLALNFTYYDTTNQVDATSYVTTTMTYSNLNVNIAGYYYQRYTATDGMFYDLEFKVVFKLGTPVTGASRTPQEHIHYNYSSTWEDQLLSYGEIAYIGSTPQPEATIQSYTYDNQGNPISITNFKYEGYTSNGAAILSWSGRELTSIYIPLGSGDSITIDYRYNDQGYRTQKTIIKDINAQVTEETIQYELIHDKVIYETNGTYGILFTYDYDGTLISFNYDDNINDQTHGIEYFYIRNQMGDITHITNSSGNVVVHYQYDAYGNIIDTDTISGYSVIASINPYRYRGYRYDEEVGLYYLNSRYYNPEVGRFINADKVLGQLSNCTSTNMYAYSNNNPISYTDEDGDFWHLLGGFVIGAAIGAASKIVSNLVMGEKWSDGVVTATLVGGLTGAMTAAGVGSLTIGLVAGIGTASGNQIEQYGLNLDEWNVKEFVVDAVITGVLVGVGSAYGSKKIGASAKQVKNWWKPGSFTKMVTGNYMKKITKAVAYSALPAINYVFASTLNSDQSDSANITIE